MYVKIVLTLLVLLAAAIVVALARPRVAAVAGEVDDPLDARVPVVKFSGLPLEKAVAALHESTGTNIVVKWGVLADHGLARDTLVDADLRDVPLRGALRAVFEQRRVPVPQDKGVDWPLTYASRDGVVTVADGLRDPAPTVVRVYDVRDLTSDDYFSRLPRRPPNEGPYGRRGEPAGQDERMDVLILLVGEAMGVSPGGGGGAGLFSPIIPPAVTAATPTGPAASISGFGGRLVVVDTPDGQREVETVLRKLREAK